VIDTSSNTVVASVGVGIYPVGGVAITPDGTRAYVSNRGSNYVSVIDTSGNTVVATVVVGDLPYGVAITPDGTRAYVTNAYSNSVSVIDTNPSDASYNTVVATVGVGDFPGAVAITPASPYAAQIQQPINSDGSSVFSVKRGVVPVKFTLTLRGNTTCQLPTANISLTRTAGTSVGSVDESTYLLASDSGSNFRTSSCQYVYNLGTGSLGTGTYAVNISIRGSVVGSGTFGLQ
jgi:YVTN family beta-propeller protein